MRKQSLILVFFVVLLMHVAASRTQCCKYSQCGRYKERRCCVKRCLGGGGLAVADTSATAITGNVVGHASARARSIGIAASSSKAFTTKYAAYATGNAFAASAH
eukprot:TRINITY_DN4089_c0_g1_i3.p9 TRINITY_DN4089_c0_g1~~TRINITY_DN4089_c0_g1_i3.p9  ORF type:complete len:104 (-),score=12.93 TRINITY_DN4089_c0_g1_i3:553-864(-)